MNRLKSKQFKAAQHSQQLPPLLCRANSFFGAFVSRNVFSQYSTTNFCDQHHTVCKVNSFFGILFFVFIYSGHRVKRVHCQAKICLKRILHYKYEPIFLLAFKLELYEDIVGLIRMKLLDILFTRWPQCKRFVLCLFLRDATKTELIFFFGDKEVIFRI